MGTILQRSVQKLQIL